MIEQPRVVKLRNGDEVILRTLRKGDRQLVIDFFKNLTKQDRLFLRHDVTELERIDARLEKIDYDRLIPIIAEKDGKIIADAELEQSVHGWRRHIGEIRVVVATNFQRLGLGELMVRELLQIAAEKGLEKIEAKMMEQQEGALGVMTRLGFEKVAEIPDYAKDLDGKRHNMYIMLYDLSEIQHRMQDAGHLPIRY